MPWSAIEGYLLAWCGGSEPTSCKVMTILHPNFNAAGVVSRTRDNGIITGSADYAADGACVLTNLNRNTLTQKRSGHHHRPRRGSSRRMCWWAWSKVVPEVSGKSSIAVITPGTDPRTVRHAFIITNF